MTKPLNHVVILGGGTSGWMCAAVLGAFVGKSTRVTLVESADIGIIGVGEATVPSIRQFNAMLDIKESDFMRATNATYKLGIQFNDWLRIGHSYLHPFGTYGLGQDLGQFHYIYLNLIEQGKLDPEKLPPEVFSICAQAALNHKAGPQEANPASPYSRLQSAYHFDASLYGQFMRKFAESKGVVRREGEVINVALNPDNGHVKALHLKDGSTIEADLFIDCSGFRSLLLGQALSVDYVDWSHWLPMDTAFAQPCENADLLAPYTASSATKGGWTWRIPLQHRTGNGHVFASTFMDDEAALNALGAALKGKALMEPKKIKFKAGRRAVMWDKNVVAIGLASGFLEPLESTSIYFVQSAIQKLLQHFPDQDFAPHNRALFNRRLNEDYDHVRDFIIMHYHLTERDDSELWNHVRTMTIPDSLTERLGAFRERGLILTRSEEMFGAASWFAIGWGQGIRPQSTSPMIVATDISAQMALMERTQDEIKRFVASLPSHSQYLKQAGLLNMLVK